LPEEISLEQVDIWFQDEARIGQQNTVTRIWAKTRTRPRIVRQRQFLASYIFGAACPKTGKSAAIIMPKSDTEAMFRHLQCISETLETGRHAVIVMDRAAWHTTDKLEKLNNISLVFLPPTAPELNPIEQVWRQLREDSLANRCFQTYDDILDACCDAWNNFANNYEFVKSLCHREWAVL